MKSSDVLSGLKVAILTVGYVGMVPIMAQKSDLGVIIAGVRTPYVIRRVPIRPTTTWSGSATSMA